jgi:hypothetical protein
MKNYMPIVVTCCVVIPVALLIGLFFGAPLGRSSGVVGLIVILLVAAYSRRLSAAKKLER